MKVYEFPQPYVDLYGAHQFLAQLGFDTADLYVGFDVVVNWGPSPMLFLQLKTQGKSFVFVIGPVPGATRESVLQRWLEFTKLINSASPEDQKKCWVQSEVGLRESVRLRFLSTLHLRGFDIPAFADRKSDLDLMASTFGRALQITSPGGQG